MTPQEMKKALKDKYDSGIQAKRLKYHQHIDGMTTALLQQEYDLVILGKKYVAPKKQEKKERLSKKELKEVEKDLKEDDIEGVW